MQGSIRDTPKKSELRSGNHNLSLNFYPHPGFELHSKVIIMDSDALNQTSDQCLIVLDNLSFLLIQKGFKVWNLLSDSILLASSSVHQIWLSLTPWSQRCMPHWVMRLNLTKCCLPFTAGLLERAVRETGYSGSWAIWLMRWIADFECNFLFVNNGTHGNCSIAN